MRFLILSFLLFSANAYSTGGGDDDDDSDSNNQDQGQDQYQNQDQEQYQGQEQFSTSESLAESSAVVTNDNSFSTSTVVKARAPDIVMVPNNNTSNCMKVYGLSFSTREGGAGIGWPYRDKSCDFESAADDASAQGQHTIAWYWRCHKKNLYKQFGKNSHHKEQRIQACHQRMMQLIVTQPVTAAFPDDPDPLVNPCKHKEIHSRIFEKCQEGK